jgi:predicted Zn-dependent protease
MANLWIMDELKQSLALACETGQVTGWLLAEDRVHRRERYFLTEADAALAIDQDRASDSFNVVLTLFVDIGIEQRQGEISKKLFMTLPLAEQLAAALAAARQTDQARWALPPAYAAPLPGLLTADPRLQEDMDGCMEQMTARIAAAVQVVRPTRFNSAELFMSLHQRQWHLSNGFSHAATQTRIYVEAAYSMTQIAADDSAGGEPVSDEYLHTQWAVNMDDIDVPALFDETSERAMRMLQVQAPVAGNYPVIIHADVLATLFHDLLSQLSAVNAYNQLPYIAPGAELIKAAQGDLLTLALDPDLPFGADTALFSEAGVRQQKLTLVDKNIVLASAADQQHASYLNLPVTTVRGNIVVAPGTLSHAELSQAGPLVIEILQFSGLFTDANSGTFSSEIRLARVFDNVNGSVHYIKGGSLSGAVADNFKGLRLSREVVRHAHFTSAAPRGQGYLGPQYALLSDVSIAG